jgi:P4 family phage/plasmid primase-like protien
VYEWDKMIKKNYTIATLRHLAKKDNPTQYNQFIKDKIQNKIKDSLDGAHNDIAKVLEEEYGNEFVCASITNKIWYQFKDHIWQEMEEGNFLREKISDDNGLIEKYREQMRECVNNLGGDDKAEKAMYEARMKQVAKIIGNLKSAPFKNNVMKEAMEVFYKREFKQKLDQNKNLIAFKNGVYDLNENKFRDGLPEDYISKCLPIDYKTYQDTDAEVENVVEFLQKVFPDTSIRNYFLDTYSDIFVGGNTQKKVYLWTGEGDNGKSITQAFFDRMLGELAIKFNTQYFTGKKVSTGSANPELSRAAPPVRHVTMEEPDADETLNIGELKKLSGGDTYWARDLFEKGKSTREVKPMFTLTFICNKLPKLKYSDKATWNRLRVIPFESTFVEPGQPCPKTFEEQLLEKKFPMDKQFDSKIQGMVGAFAWYLLEWRKKVTIRVEPEKVKEATAVYRRQNDIYRQFIEENITEDKNAYIALAEIYAHFKEWYKEGWSNMTVPIKNEVKEYFERLWGDTEKGYRWRGYRIRTLQEDLDAGNAIVLEEDDLINYDDENGKALPPM